MRVLAMFLALAFLAPALQGCLGGDDEESFDTGASSLKTMDQYREQMSDDIDDSNVDLEMKNVMREIDADS